MRNRQSSARSSLFVAALLSIAAAFSVARAAPLTLPDDSWQLLVLPGDAAGASISALFGDRLPIEDYTRTWTIFVPDADGRYAEPAPDATLPTGSAFWMVQKTGADVSLDLALASFEGTLDPGCTSSYGCLTMPLETQTNATVWSARGAPAGRPTALADLRLVSGTGACRDGCDLAEAAAVGITAGALWSLFGTNGVYRELGVADTLRPWEGFWIPIRTGETLIGTVSLVIPLGEADLAHCT